LAEAERSRAETAAASAEISASFPVVRKAMLLLARDPSNKLIHTFTYEQGERAIDEIARRKDDFHRAIRAGLAAGAEAAAFPKDSVLERPPLNLKTSSAARNQGLGAVYDFDDMALDLNGAWLLLCRVCLTVCVEQDFLDRNSAAADPSHSKIWVRFILVEHPGRERRRELACEVNAKAVGTFADYCEKISQAVMKQVVPLYKDVTSTVAEKTLKIEKKQTLSFLTVGVESAHYARTAAELAQGATLKKLQRVDPLASYLRRLGEAVLGADVFDNPDVQFLQYRTPRGECALYLGAFDHGGPSFVGVTDRKNDRDASREAEMRPASLAANHASAGFSMEYGARF